MQSDAKKRYSILVVSTLSFTVCFMVWFIFSVLGVRLQALMGFNAAQLGVLVAMPILSGALVRVPLGILTDRFGGRIVLFCLMLFTVPFIYLVAYANAYWQLIVIGLVMGLAGGSFSVGTPYVARWFPKHQQGMAMGIFGAGNAGSSLNNFIAPTLIAIGTWHLVPKVYAVVMLVTAFIFWFGSHHNPAHIVKEATSIKTQLKLFKDPGVLRLSQFYTVVFGGYVGMALWMTKYYKEVYMLDLKTAALLAAAFALPGGVLRAIGGWLSDKFGARRVTWTVLWVCFICLFILSYPPTTFQIMRAGGLPPANLHIQLNVVIFTILLFVIGIAMAFGKASVFKSVADEYPHNIGAVSGVVGLAGGVGGFLLPIMFGILLDWTGVPSTAFMLVFGAVGVSLILMHLAYKREDKQKGIDTPRS